MDGGSELGLTPYYIACHKFDGQMTLVTVCQGCVNPCPRYLTSDVVLQATERNFKFYSESDINGFRSVTKVVC